MNCCKFLSFPTSIATPTVIANPTATKTPTLFVAQASPASPETNEPFEKEATEENKKLVEGKTVTLEYDNYKGDKFGRILAYLIIDGKNISIELARKGMAQVVIYQHKKSWIYQDQLLKSFPDFNLLKVSIINFLSFSKLGLVIII